MLHHRKLLLFAAMVALGLLPPGLAAAVSNGGEPVGEAVQGTISQRGSDGSDGTPIPGVAIVVRLDGEQIGEDTTDEQGAFFIPVPGPGTYEVELVEETLPEGAVLRNPDRNPLSEFVVRPGQQKNALFPLEGGGAAGRGGLDRLVNLATKGLAVGSIVALGAVGLSVIFGLTGLINFAHGELVTFGALMAWLFNASGAGPRWALIPASAAALATAALLGGSLERGLFGPLRRRQVGNVAMMIISFGLSIFLRNTYLLFFGGRSRPYRQYAVQRAQDFGPISIPPKDLVIIGISVTTMVLVGLMLQRTRTGTAMRAVADDPDLAASSGIDVNRVVLVAWVIGTMLASVAGIFLGVTETVEFDMGFKLLLVMFAAMIVGGIGTAYGAMVGGLLIGVAMEVSTFWLDAEFKLVTALVVLILTLLVRPQGIFGLRERVG